MIKTPELHFYDTGLAVWLPGIRQEKELGFLRMLNSEGFDGSHLDRLRTLRKWAPYPLRIEKFVRRCASLPFRLLRAGQGT
jgi:hypothetical protein